MKILKKIICICLVAILAAGLFPGAQTEVYAAGKPVQLVSCKVNSVGSKVTVKAKVAGIQKGMGKKTLPVFGRCQCKRKCKTCRKTGGFR